MRLWSKFKFWFKWENRKYSKFKYCFKTWWSFKRSNLIITLRKEGRASKCYFEFAMVLICDWTLEDSPKWHKKVRTYSATRKLMVLYPWGPHPYNCTVFIPICGSHSFFYSHLIAFYWAKGLEGQCFLMSQKSVSRILQENTQEIIFLTLEVTVTNIRQPLSSMPDMRA